MVAVLVLGPSPVGKNSSSADRGAYVPLSGARISLLGTNMYSTTNSDGYATVDNVPAGTYVVTVGKDGYQASIYNSVTVGGGATTQVGPATGVEIPTSTAPYILDVSTLNAAIGTSVTITGSNFGAGLSKSAGSSTVTFNGIIATATSWSSTQIVCTVPGGATTGDLIVTVGAAASNSVTFTVTGGGTPEILSLNPTSGAVGTTVTITGTNFGSSQGSSLLAFNGNPATSITSWSDTQIVCAVPASATTGNVVVTVNGINSNGMSFGVLAWRAMTSGTSETLNAIWGTSDGINIFAVGTNFTIRRYDSASGTWVTSASGLAGGAFKGVWGSSANKVFACGTGGNIREYNGTSWSDSSSGTAINLNGIWGWTSGDTTYAFAVGDADAGAATLRYYTGTAWENRVSLATENLLAIWGKGDGSNTYAVGASGEMVRYTGAWNPVGSGTGYNLLGVWGSGSSNIFAISQNDGVIGRWNGTSWNWTNWNPAVPGVTGQLNGIWGSSGSNIYVVGNGYKMLYYNGTVWSSVTLPSDPSAPNLIGVWGTSSTNVYAVGANGTILHYGTN